MKLGILEWNVASLGGRQRTMMCFADAAKQLGHDVCVYTNFLEKDFVRLSPMPGYGPGTFLDWFGLKHLAYDDIRLINLQRTYRFTDVPDDWRTMDVLIVPYGGYGYLQGLLPNVRVISWVIHPDQNRCHGVPYEVWTNSHTTARRLAQSPKWQAEKNVRIVIPPHDYSMFREARRPWSGRGIDVAIVGLLHPDKGVVEAVQICQGIGVNCFVAGHTCKAMEADNAAILVWLEGRGVQVHTNLKREAMAELLGNSKTLLIMSRAESCPLIVYEAMNAQTAIVARDIGAISEQTGIASWLFRDDSEAEDRLQLALCGVSDVMLDEMSTRGMRFDRQHQLSNLIAALEHRP